MAYMTAVHFRKVGMGEATRNVQSAEALSLECFPLFLHSNDLRFNGF